MEPYLYDFSLDHRKKGSLSEQRIRKQIQRQRSKENRSRTGQTTHHSRKGETRKQVAEPELKVEEEL